MLSMLSALTKWTVILGTVAGLVAVTCFLAFQWKPNRESDLISAPVARGELSVYVVEQGTIESSNNTEIRNKVRGFSVVTEVVEVGQVVNKGDVLVRLDTKAIEEQISTARTNVNTAKADLARSTANVETAKIAIDAYLNGRYKSQVDNLNRLIEIASERLKNAQKIEKETKLLFSKSLVTRYEMDSAFYEVRKQELELGVQRNALMVLEKYSRKKQLATLNGELVANQSKRESDRAALKEEEKRLARLRQELADCIIRAPRDGLVIYPSAAAWKETPDIDEGASVRMDQVLLLMPDLKKMQIKVGIHESIVDQLEIGQRALISPSESEDVFSAYVSKIANVTKPAGWWTGNVVKYDTIIDLPNGYELKPGMSAEVKIVLAEHPNVLKIPVAAVVEMQGKHYCWTVDGAGAIRKRQITVECSNDVEVALTDGVSEDEQVVLSPLDFVAEDSRDVSRVGKDG